MEAPRFTFLDVKYVDSDAMFARAEKLFRDGKVGTIKEIGLGSRAGYRAVVKGTHPYEVRVSARKVDEGDCACPMGERELLCKHMLALALAVLTATGVKEEPAPTNLAEAKLQVTAGMRKIRAYDGPSRIWFSYQRSLDIGCGMIQEAVSDLSATKEHADYLWKLVLRLSNKLATSGVDDSNGTVGDCVYALVAKLGEYAKESPDLWSRILAYCKDDTGFGFEDELRDLLKEKGH